MPDRCASGSKIAAGLSVIQGDPNPNVGGIVSDCCAIRMLAVLQRSVLMDDECAVRIAVHFGDETRVSSRNSSLSQVRPPRRSVGALRPGLLSLQPGGLAFDRGPHPIQKSVTCLPQLRRYYRHLVGCRNRQRGITKIACQLIEASAGVNRPAIPFVMVMVHIARLSE